MVNKQVLLDYKNDAVVLDELLSSNYGEHNIIIYPDNHTLRNIYSGYCKSLFENNYNNNGDGGSYEDNEMVLLIPNYETVQGVKYTLEKRAGINVQKHERNGSLAIVDSYKAYSSYHSSNNNDNNTMYNITSIVGFLLKEAECIYVFIG